MGISLEWHAGVELVVSINFIHFSLDDDGDDDDDNASNDCSETINENEVEVRFLEMFLLSDFE